VCFGWYPLLVLHSPSRAATLSSFFSVKFFSLFFASESWLLLLRKAYLPVSSDGVLTLKAPPPPSKEQAKSERIVQIQQTGPAHLSVKAPENSEGKAENGGGEKMETGK